MKKISGNKTDTLLLKFVIKSVLSTIATILLFSFLFSEVIYKLDISLDSIRIVSIIICVLCTVLISFISVNGLKNNGALMGIISCVPLIFYSLINVIFSSNSIIYFLIKLVIILLVAALTGLIAAAKSRKFKVK